MEKMLEVLKNNKGKIIKTIQVGLVLIGLALITSKAMDKTGCTDDEETYELEYIEIDTPEVVED